MKFIIPITKPIIADMIYTNTKLFLSINLFYPNFIKNIPIAPIITNNIEKNTDIKVLITLDKYE